MIVHSLYAENIFRFHRVQLTDLPARGVIAIQGPNESGKSSILEMLNLALFGRTSKFSDNNLGQVICWGETRGEVRLSFIANDGKRYVVTRYLDTEGSHRASLVSQDEADRDSPVAQGVVSVNRAIVKRLGFGYADFMEILFLTQQGESNGWAREATLRRLSGVALLEQVVEEFSDEVIEMAGESQNSGHRIEQIQEMLEELDLDEDSLESLESERKAVEEARVVLDRRIRQIRSFDTALQGAISQVEEGALPRLGPSDDLMQWKREIHNALDSLDTLDRVCNENVMGVEEMPTRHLRTVIHRREAALVELEGLMDEMRLQKDRWKRWLGETVPHPPQQTFQEQEEPNQHKNYLIVRTQLQRRRDHALMWQQRLGWGSSLFALTTVMLTILWHLSLLANMDSVPQEMVLGGGDIQMTVGAAWWSWSHASFAILSGLVAAVGSLGFWRFTMLKRRIFKQMQAQDKQARYGTEQVRRLEAVLNKPVLARFHELITLTDAPWTEQLSRWLVGTGASLTDSSLASEAQQELKDEVQAMVIRLTGDRQQLNQRLGDASTERESLSERIYQLEEAMTEEQHRRSEDERLRRELTTTHKEHVAQRHGVRVREISLELLAGAQRAFNTRFDREMRRWVSELAPRYTQGRYRYLRFNEEMKIEAFSNEQNGFVHMESLSSGVQRQLYLALRLTLAQALSAHAVKGAQLLALDEPFAFFDQERARLALQALREPTDPLSQIWIATPHLPLMSQESLEKSDGVLISCKSDEHSLTHTEAPL
uniref:Rad50/SbcC-type AAA domain-containing protein n=1 Tax=Magnetococcus massalia (strain MO-1) TaxID=451514 RepID=A0A1S7LLW6_MAGMO|nr:conserved protein of unknown function [Include RecF/RecN/SMC protein, N-terminal domain] [Candidatus Magnetococcus massalia]